MMSPFLTEDVTLVLFQLTALAGRVVGEEGGCKNVFFSAFSWMSCHQESLVKSVYIVLLIGLKCSEDFLGLPTALNYRLGVSANSATNFG